MAGNDPTPNRPWSAVLTLWAALMQSAVLLLSAIREKVNQAKDVRCILIDNETRTCTVWLFLFFYRDSLNYILKSLLTNIQLIFKIKNYIF